MARSRPHVAVVALVGLLLAAPAATQEAERIGLTHAAGQPDGAVLPTRPSSLGPDARFVAFASRAGNLAAGDTNSAPDVILLDRASGAIERQSVTVAGVQSPQGGLEGVASPDGTRVVLRSTGKLVPSDVTGFADLYLRDRAQGTLVRLTGGVFGEFLDADVVGWDATTDLSEVFFTTRASNVFSGDANGALDVFRRVVATGVTTRITAANSGPPPTDDPATAVDASSDGAFVAFDSSSASLVPMDTNGRADVFVRTRATGVVERISVAWNGASPDGESTRPSISDDGRYVAFVSGATNLVAGGDTNGWIDVYLRDRLTATTMRASLDAQGLEVAAPASGPWMAPAGGWVAFRSTGAFLSGDVAGSWKLLARDLVAGGLAPLVASVDGQPFIQPLDLLAATPDAGVLLVASAAPNLVAGDSNAAADLFLVERPPRALRTICAGDGTAEACPCANGGGIGRDCASSLGSPGALLVALGEPDPLLDTLTLHATRLPSGTIALFLQGTITQSGGQGLAFGDGLRCAAGTIVRLAQRVAAGGSASLVRGRGSAAVRHGARAAGRRNARGPGVVPQQRDVLHARDVQPDERRRGHVGAVRRVLVPGLIACVLPVLDAGAAPAAQGGLRVVDSPAEAAPLERVAQVLDAVDQTGVAPAFVEVETPRTEAFVGELVALEVRFGLDVEFLEREVVPLFRRRLDAPLLIEASWLEEPRSLDLGRLFVAVPPEARVLVARNDFVAEARRLDDRVVNGRTWRVFALDVRRVETEPGRVVLAGPRLHFARGTGFRDDFLSGRTATGRVDAFVRGPDLVLDVRPVPTEGRPANWSGAVGVFDLEASASFDVTARPATARVDLVFAGTGNLSEAELAGPDAFPGFRVLGTLDDRGHARRTVRVDLEFGSGNVRAVPPLEFVHFDPRPPGAWRVARSDAFPLPAGATWSAVARGPADVPPAEPPGAGFAAAGSVRVLFVAALVGAVILGGVALALARRLRG